MAPECAKDIILTDDFQDSNDDEINDLIQCTAPRSLAKAWISGGITQKHIDDGILFMINESYDRNHAANEFMANVHHNYQYYFAADLTSEVVKAVEENDVHSVAFRDFFSLFLDKSADYKMRNKRHCIGQKRYNEKSTRVNIARSAKRAFR